MTEDKSAPRPGCECAVCEALRANAEGNGRVRPDTAQWRILMRKAGLLK